MNTARTQRLAVLGVLTPLALITMAVRLGATCDIPGCGGPTSSIWLRMAYLLVPMLLTVIGSWRLARGGTGWAALVIGAPWLVVATICFGWVLSYAGSGAVSSSGGATELSGPVVGTVLSALWLGAPWAAVVALAGVSRLTRAIGARLRSRRGLMAVGASALVSVAVTAAICFTSAAGSSGLDADPAPGALSAQVQSCPDLRFTNCTTVASISPGGSVNLGPGLYQLVGEGGCGGVTTPVQLFPLERIEVSFPTCSLGGGLPQ